MLISNNGRQTPLGANTLGGLTGGQFLSALFGGGGGGGGGGARAGLRPRQTRLMNMMQDDEDEEEEEEEEDDEDEMVVEEDWMGRRRTVRRGTRYYPVTKEPEPKGLELLRSGDFGRVRSFSTRSSRADADDLDRHRDTSPTRQESGPAAQHPCTAPFASPNPPSSPLLPAPVSPARLRYLRSPLEGLRTVRRTSRIRTGRKWRLTARGSTADGIRTMESSSTLARRLTRSTSTTCARSPCSRNVVPSDFRGACRTKPPTVIGSKSVSDTQPLAGGNDDGDAVRPPWGFGRGFRSDSFRHRSSLHLSRTFQARERDCRWTITDAALSPDNNFLIYSSITPLVHLVKTRGQDAVMGLGLEEHEQERLDFSERGGFGIWSLRFSSDGKQIAAGCSDGIISVFDIETKRPVMSVRGHEDDTNAVRFLSL